ncbi:Uncharacterised protein [Cedecea lapagei]|uniref:Uncharacterized protein n=1 Tax=Cedecea lapagei TaxID=158823 RepID=A0A3S4MDV6_9ENTR|nr:hypothetical protein [Cedecea lapagei]VEB96081.1 Uncharacterised protein [Cedecea lapagei]
MPDASKETDIHTVAQKLKTSAHNRLTYAKDVLDKERMVKEAAYAQHTGRADCQHGDYHQRAPAWYD